MADNDKRTELVCFAGEDPKNPRTKGAYATLFEKDTGRSVYHLSPKVVELGPLERALEKNLGDYKADKSGIIRLSQPEGAPNRNPWLLNPAINGITIEFKGGKATECRLDTGHNIDNSVKIPIVDKIPTPAAPPTAPGVVRKAEIALEPTMG